MVYESGFRKDQDRRDKFSRANVDDIIQAYLTNTKQFTVNTWGRIEAACAAVNGEAVADKPVTIGAPSMARARFVPSSPLASP